MRITGRGAAAGVSAVVVLVSAIGLVYEPPGASGTVPAVKYQPIAGEVAAVVPRVAKAAPAPKPQTLLERKGLTTTARAVRWCESRDSYKRGNGGAYQFIDSTWHAVTGLRGHAQQYPAAVQDRAFVKLWNGGRGARNWSPSRSCWIDKLDRPLDQPIRESESHQ